MSRLRNLIADARWYWAALKGVWRAAVEIEHARLALVSEALEKEAVKKRADFPDDDLGPDDCGHRVRP